MFDTTKARSHPMLSISCLVTAQNLDTYIVDWVMVAIFDYRCLNCSRLANLFEVEAHSLVIKGLHEIPNLG